MLTPSAGRARKGARWRGPAEAGARPFPIKASTTTAAIRRLINAGRRSWAAAAFADPIRFPGRRMGPATPGVSRARAAAGSPQVNVAPLGLRYSVAFGAKRTLTELSPSILPAPLDQICLAGLS